MAWARRVAAESAEVIVLPIKPRKKIWVLVDAEHWESLTRAARDLVRSRSSPP